MSQGDGGKGSDPRPFSVPLDEFAANHERIFGKKPPRPRYVPTPLPDEPVDRLLASVAGLEMGGINPMMTPLMEHAIRAGRKEASPLPDQMEGARRALQDCTDFGIGSYRQHADGTTEYIDRATLAPAKK